MEVEADSGAEARKAKVEGPGDDHESSEGSERWLEKRGKGLTFCRGRGGEAAGRMRASGEPGAEKALRQPRGRWGPREQGNQRRGS